MPGPWVYKTAQIQSQAVLVLTPQREAASGRFCLSTGGAVQVSDFGLSRLSKGKYVESKVYGKVTHMPPEVIIEGLVSRASDAYSFGVLLWEMYTGQEPWAHMRPTSIIQAVTDGQQLQFPASTPPEYKVCPPGTMRHACPLAPQP